MKELFGSEPLEWRDHDSASEITHTGFGPYMVERLPGDGRFRVWLPDDNKIARLMVDEFRSRDEAREFCQRVVDGQRALTAISGLAMERGEAVQSLRGLVEGFEAYEDVDPYLAAARATLAKAGAK